MISKDWIFPEEILKKFPGIRAKKRLNSTAKYVGETVHQSNKSLSGPPSSASACQFTSSQISTSVNIARDT